MSVLELRQYTLKPGKRDTLIELFEREFVESQEEQGMELIGTFRDADDAGRFVWLRRFADMEARAAALAAFYGGPVWKAHRNAANETMIDSDNVLLLKPAWPGADFANRGTRAAAGASGPVPGLVLTTIHYFDPLETESFMEMWRAVMPRRVADAGGTLAAACITDASANTFPALPVREGETAFVSFVLFADAASAPIELEPALPQAVRANETLRLLPTARSRLHA